MERVSATLYALIGIFLVFMMVSVLLDCAAEWAHNGPCGTPLASLQVAIPIYFPIIL